MRLLRTLNWIGATIALLGLGALGLYNGSQDLQQTGSALQRSVFFAGLLYGILGVSAGVALVFRKRAAIPLAVAWSMSIVYAASVASFAFSDPDFSERGTIAGVIGAAVTTMLISAWVIWAARIALRDSDLTPGIHEGDIPPR